MNVSIVLVAIGGVLQVIQLLDQLNYPVKMMLLHSKTATKIPVPQLLAQFIPPP